MLFLGRLTDREWKRDHEHYHTIPDDCRCLGGVALLGFAGEARACPLAEAAWTSNEPYICDVSQPAGGTIQKVTWRVTFSEPVGGVSWHDFFTDNTNDYVSGNSGPRYGLGSVDEEIKKVSDTVYDISMEWDCTSSNNDCHHNETVTTACEGGECTTSYSSSGRIDPYVGEVWLEMQSDAEFNEMHAPPLLGQSPSSHVGLPTAKVSIN